MTFDISSDELAEALVRFMDYDDNVYNAYCNESVWNDVSIAEFVYEHCAVEFRSYCEDVLGFNFID